MPLAKTMLVRQINDARLSCPRRTPAFLVRRIWMHRHPPMSRPPLRPDRGPEITGVRRTIGRTSIYISHCLASAVLHRILFWTITPSRTRNPRRTDGLGQSTPGASDVQTQYCAMGRRGRNERKRSRPDRFEKRAQYTLRAFGIVRTVSATSCSPPGLVDRNSATWVSFICRGSERAVSDVRRCPLRQHLRHHVPWPVCRSAIERRLSVIRSTFCEMYFSTARST